MTSGMHRRADGLTCLGLFSGHTTHVLGVQLYRVIAKFGLSSCLEIMTAHRKVTVPLHPPGKTTDFRDDGNTKAGKTRHNTKMWVLETFTEPMALEPPLDSQVHSQSTCKYQGILCTLPHPPLSAENSASCYGEMKRKYSKNPYASLCLSNLIA